MPDPYLCPKCGYPGFVAKHVAAVSQMTILWHVVREERPEGIQLTCGGCGFIEVKPVGFWRYRTNSDGKVTGVKDGL